jgi:hypothetical protein
MFLYLFIFAAAFILLLALLRLFYPRFYAERVLRITDQRAQIEWMHSSSKAGSIAALIGLALILLGILARRSH